MLSDTGNNLQPKNPPLRAAGEGAIATSAKLSHDTAIMT
jgi:hypothetical protein